MEDNHYTSSKESLRHLGIRVQDPEKQYSLNGEISAGGLPLASSLELEALRLRAESDPLLP